MEHSLLYVCVCVKKEKGCGWCSCTSLKSLIFEGKEERDGECYWVPSQRSISFRFLQNGW